MQAAHNIEALSVTEYLEGELTSTVRHEFIDGYVYAMSDAKKNHQRIAINLTTEFVNHLEHSACEPFTSDMKVRVGDNFFYPDAMVACPDRRDDDYYINGPVIIVEILSPSTRHRDQTFKRDQYLSIPSLQEYVLIEQDVVDVEVIRRNDHWRSSHYFMGDQVTLDSIDLSVSVETIYRRVQNADVTDYLTEQTELQT